MTIEAPSAPTLEWLREQKAEIQRLARANHASQDVRVFGSVARGDAHSGSDVDLLVRFTPGASLFDLIALEMALTECLGVPVDVVSTGATGYVADRARAQSIEL